ncbi:unnamed protein product [Rotaria sp. Silwood2]|nr:unnamed protein product [Rotaria sp. Silwood2]
MSLCRRPIRRIVIAAKTGLVINKTILRSFSQQSIYKQLEATHLNAQQPQLIGEERQDDAIYKIYLKKVRHKSSSRLNSSSTINTLVDDTNEQNETTGDTCNDDHGALLYSTIKVYQLKAGTLEKIVECLTNDTGELDATNMHILFSTYRTFTNTRTLIDTIIIRYRAVLPASLDMTEDVRQKTLKFKPSQTLLEDFKIDEETNQLNNDNNKSKTNVLYNEKGFDYIQPWNILEISSTIIAEQLTIVDADLLKRVLPYECLTPSTSGCSRRTPSNNSNRTLSTIDKTIEFFNAVVARVIATILKEQDEEQRSHVIEKWIDVAHQCRKIKNFSSLTAILNGLLSGCIYRLNTAWSYVTQDYQSILEELKKVFGSCADRKEARAILDKECTTKYADVTAAINVTLGRKFRHKMTRDQQKPTMLGTIPYLGFYLSDLTYIDSAYPNTIIIEDDNTSSSSSKKLINFEKHRKEFEVLAQIKLFQSAANAYTTLHPLPRFKAWFDNVRIYNDTESWELSYQIEPKEVTDNCQYVQQLLQNIGSPIRNNERTNSVLKCILDKFGFDPSTNDQYCIEQQLPDRKILILDHCNVFYALARSSDDEQVELIVREKTRQERQAKSNNSLISAGHNRTPSGFSTSSIHSR